MLSRDAIPLANGRAAYMSAAMFGFQMLSDLTGAAERVDDVFDVHAVVKPELTSSVKWDLACIAGAGDMIAFMYTEDEKAFSARHLQAMGKRMEQAVRMSKQNKSQVAGKMGVSRAAMTQYCKGETTPTLVSLARFCQATKSPMDYIVFGTTPELESSLIPMLEDLLLSKKRPKSPA